MATNDSLSTKMAASFAGSKVLSDAIFGASGAANEAIAKYGADKVTNATIGSIYDNDEKLACIPTMEKTFRSMPTTDLVAYAPIAGLPNYLEAVIDLTFADNRPEGYVSAVATAGGTGAVHHAIDNYAEKDEYVLTGDWFWGPYNVICQETGKKLTTFTLFDENLNFNIASFSEKVHELLSKQDSLLIIINTPAHNPTGYSLSEEDWKNVLDVVKAETKSGKRVSILVDIAYIDYAGEKNETRKFMKQFGGLPANIFVMFAFSMSKGYTLYGQRTGAIIGLSSDKEVIDEFTNCSKFSSRATWSNINRGAMSVLTTIQQDAALLESFETERDAIYQTIRERAAVFMDEAEKCGLVALPYKAGFFISIPSSNPKAVCDKLHDDLIFAVPLKLGVRIAICGVALNKVYGMAEKVHKAIQAVEG